MAKRQGLNSTLSYKQGTKTYAIRLRVDSVTYSVRQIAAETQGRTYRTFYPHFRTQAPFAINALLNGHEEYRTMNNWFAEYASYALSVSYNDGLWPEMSVNVPSRNFVRSGIPVGTFEWGDRIGKALWSQTIQFETTKEAGDNTFKTSTFDGTQAGVRDPSTLYYYPSATQLSGNAKPTGYYPTVPEKLDFPKLQALVQNGTVDLYYQDGTAVTADGLSEFLGYDEANAITNVTDVSVLGTVLSSDTPLAAIS